MNKVSDYTKKLNRFGSGLEKMLKEDFPENQELSDKVEGSILTIQHQILGAFLEKGGSK